jgi:hypothetical protein
MVGSIRMDKGGQWVEYIEKSYFVAASYRRPPSAYAGPSPDPMTEGSAMAHTVKQAHSAPARAAQQICH